MSAALSDEAARSAEPGERAELVHKAAAVAALVHGLRHEALQLQAHEAVMRGALTGAVLAGLDRDARARAALRRLAVRTSPATRVGGVVRRVAWRLRSLLFRLGWPGQAVMLAASGFWRPSGRPLYDLRHIAAYLRRGANPEVAPASFFDQAWYLRRYPDVADLNLAPLSHYMRAGQLEGRSPHPLFDAEFYASQNAEHLKRTRLWPLAHFVAIGARAGRDPHPLFDAAHYLAQAPDLLLREDAASHYIRAGWRQGLSPHPLFDPVWYRSQMPAEATDVPPLVHFVAEGAARGLSPHPLFDPAWYLTQAPQAQRSGLDPLRHYLAVGAAHGLSPSRWFDPAHYAARRGEALAPGANPLIDYLQGGAWQVDEPAPGFSTAAYIAAHPELVAQGLTPLAHWAGTATERPKGD